MTRSPINVSMCYFSLSGLVSNTGLYHLYFSPNIRVTKSRRIRLVRHVAYMQMIKNTYNNLVGKFEWESTCERPSRRWKGNIKIDFGQ
jgi:hypothetical protein